jgi:hypothetical protein
MPSPILTGSGLERVSVCAAAGVLPRVETSSEYAARGHAIHAFLEGVNRVGREKALEAVPEDLRSACEALDTAKLPTDPSRYAAEVAFAFDPNTGKGRELGRGIGRRYDVNDGEIAGTADVIALLEDDGVFVSDFKSGWSRRTAARDSLQLRFYALAAARAYGRSRAVVQVIRVFEDGTTWTDEAALDAFDLDSFALELGALAAMLEGHRRLYAEGGEPPLVEGSHCTWCPAFSRCPAKTALLRAAALEAPSPSEITPGLAARAYGRLKLYKAAVEKAEEILKTYARAHAIPLEGGMVYGVRYDSTKDLDGQVAQSALEALFGESARAGIKVEVSQAGVKRAVLAYLKDHPDAGTQKALIDQALAEIEKRGGLRTVKAPKLVAHKPAAEAA